MMADLRTRIAVVRVLCAVGAVGGVLWAALPTVAVLTFYGVEIGLGGVSDLLRLGVLFQFAGSAVVFMLVGVVGVHLHFTSRYGRLGRIGASSTAIGFVLLLPGSVVPSGRVPSWLAGVVPLVFFSGLIVIALGSVTLGVAAYRSRVLPPALAIGYAGAMPIGGVIGGLAAVAGVGTIAFVVGLMVPFGLAWIALGGYVSWTW